MVTHNLYKEAIDVKLITETMGRGQKETLQKKKKIQRHKVILKLVTF